MCRLEVQFLSLARLHISCLLVAKMETRIKSRQKLIIQEDGKRTQTDIFKRRVLMKMGRRMREIMKLKPCPFCGEAPQIMTEKCMSSLEFHKGYPDNGRNLYIEKTWYFVKCTCCSLSKRFLTEQEAMEVWNRRQ